MTVPHQTATVVSAFTLTSLSTVVVALRFYSRYFLVGKTSASDYVMLAALLCCWSTAILNLFQMHYADISIGDPIPKVLQYMSGHLLTWWIYRINQMVNLCLIKISILLFYRYLAAANVTFRQLVRASFIMVIVLTTVMIIVSICNCIPVSAAYSAKVFINDLYGKKTAKCFDTRLIWYLHAGFNLITDLFILILPMPFILNLRSMPLRRRLALAGIFSLGGLAIIASAIRIYMLTQWTSTFVNEREYGGPLLIWGQVEQHAGIISSSIPFLRPVVRRICGVPPLTGIRRRSPGRDIKSLMESPSPLPDAALAPPPKAAVWNGRCAHDDDILERKFATV